MADDFLVREIPLNGRLRTNVDPATIGPSDFQTLKNMRYTDTYPKGIAGQTKINTAALANVKIKNGIHYRKDFPAAESHVVVSAQDANGANPKIYRNSTAIPSQGAFTATALFTETSGGSIPQFDIGPNGELIACNGKDTLIWGGTEYPVSKFLDWDATTNSYKYDWTNQVTNNLTDSDNIATLHRRSDTADANTMLLLHLNNNVTDSSPTTPHTVTNTNVTFSTSSKLGSHCAVFNGTNAQLEIPDNGDFDFSGGIWTFECWVYQSTLDLGALYYQGTDTNNYTEIQTTVAGRVELLIKSGGSFLVDLTTSGGAISVNQWHHIRVVENGDNYYIFINGTLLAYTSSASRPANYATTVYIGSIGGSWYYAGNIDELRISNSARATSGFTPQTSEYGTGNITDLYVASTLPLESVKFYVGTANTGVGTMTGYYWNASAWTALSSLTDGTASGGISLAQTGTVTFTSTTTTAKLKVINNTLLYWYKFSITEVDTTTTLSQVTCSSAMQQIKDIWDGSYRSMSSFQLFQGSIYKDFTTNVFENSYDTANDATIAKITSLTAASDYFVAGFSQRMSGLAIGIVGGYANTASTTITVSYWDGDSWTTLTTVDDQTLSNNCSFGQSGLIVWDAPAVTAEHKTRLAGVGMTWWQAHNYVDPNTLDSPEYRAWKLSNNGQNIVSPTGGNVNRNETDLYYYKISFSNDFAASPDCWLYYVAGIPAQEKIRGWEIPVNHAGRLFLLGSTDTRPDAYAISSYGTSQVFNGNDAIVDYFGDGLKPNAAASLVSRYGVNTISILLVTNEERAWGIYGDSLEDFKLKVVGERDGCSAPLTMDVATVPDATVAGRGRKVAVWQTNRGIVMSDGTAPIVISDDINDKFDPNHTNYVGASNLPNCQGSIDPVWGEYHWILPTGDEWVCDLTRAKDGKFPWYEVDRGAKELTGALPVMDTNGIAYHYGYDDAGYLYRLENGTNFDGVAIAQRMRLGDIAPHGGSIVRRTEFRGVKLVMAAKATTAETVAVTHYGDGATTGTSLTAMDPTNTGYRLAKIYRSIGAKPLNHVFHNTDFTISTTDETCGFEPLYVAYLYRDLGLDTK